MSSETTDADECKYVRSQPFEEECKESLRSAAIDVDGELTKKKYQEWVTAQSENLPSVGQITGEFGGSFYEVCDDLDIATDPVYGGGAYSDNDIFSAIRQAADEVSEPLTCEKYKQWQKDTSQAQPTINTITARFVWSSVCESVGVECGKHHSKEYTAENMLSAISRAAADQGEPLTVEQYSEWRDRREQKEPSASGITRRFGGWYEACERADVTHTTVHDGPQSFSMKEIEMAVQLAGEICGQPLSSTEYKAWQEDADYTYPSIQAILSRGKWTDICDQAGVEYAGQSKVRFSEEDILTSIKQAASDCGVPLTGEKYDSWRENVAGGHPAYRTVVNRMQWTEACEQAGVTHGGNSSNE